ncbi:unnamed protein product [Symbiodinium sp. CCMP2592]|nr:unnamed protein product [Symbiodinium sp. CCMP2592]CAE7825035.1 unnamed protein product [Symbiodinium sp. CCMP2592]
MPLLKRPAMIMAKATAKKQKSKHEQEEEPEVLKKPALKQDDLALVPSESLQVKIERLQNSTKGLELEDTENQFKNFFEWSLWKQFENDRLALGGSRGQQVQEQYGSIRGNGSDAKKKKLLKTYLLGGGFKDAYFAMSATYTKSISQEEESSYVPWKTALDYYGLSELKARIMSGTLHARKCPKDPRFWEVSKEVSRKKDTTSFDSKISGTASASKGKKLDDLKSFIEAGHKNPLQDMGMENFTFSDDDASEKEDDAAMDPGLKKLLGIKESPKDPVDMLETASVALSTKVTDSKTQVKVKQALSVTKVVVARFEKQISEASCSQKAKLIMTNMMKEIKKTYAELEEGSKQRKLHNAEKKCVTLASLLKKLKAKLAEE